MRSLSVVLLVLTVALAGGCARQRAKIASQDMPKAIYDQIQVGMTADQVKALAGEPASKGNPMPPGSPAAEKAGASMPVVENWVYGKVIIMISNGKVMNKMGY